MKLKMRCFVIPAFTSTGRCDVTGIAMSFRIVDELIAAASTAEVEYFSDESC